MGCITTRSVVLLPCDPITSAVATQNGMSRPAWKKKTGRIHPNIPHLETVASCLLTVLLSLLRLSSLLYNARVTKETPTLAINNNELVQCSDTYYYRRISSGEVVPARTYPPSSSPSSFPNAVPGSISQRFISQRFESCFGMHNLLAILEGSLIGFAGLEGRPFQQTSNPYLSAGESILGPLERPLYERYRSKTHISSPGPSFTVIYSTSHSRPGTHRLGSPTTDRSA